MWTSQEEMERSQWNAQLLTPLFIWCTANLLISMILTMNTPPGYIPEESEWDMPNVDEQVEEEK